MQKIMFNEQYGLQSATLKRDKWNTRRWLSNDKFKRFWWDEEKQLIYYANTFDNELVAPRELQPKYKIGEVVAIAQSYGDILASEYLPPRKEDEVCRLVSENHIGCTNKMFVRAELMPHHIQITGIKVERLQDISDEDCLAEGIYRRDDVIDLNLRPVVRYQFYGTPSLFVTPKEAYHALIDKVCGIRTWDENPWMVAYAYKLKD